MHLRHGLLVLVSLLVAADASAFCRTTTAPTDPSFSPKPGTCWTQGIFVFHQRTCVGYSIESPGSAKLDMAAFAPLVEQAFASWRASNCDGGAPTIQTMFRGNTTSASFGYDVNGGPNASAIVFRDDKWPHGERTSEVILTTLTFNRDTGEILDADMEVNTAEVDFTLTDPVPRNGTDMLSALTHEAGHFLGLAHSSDVSATMYARYTAGSTSFRTLEPDDQQGLCSIYLSSGKRVTSTGQVAPGACDPTAPPPPMSTTTSKGCSAGPRGDGTAALALLGAAVAVVLRRRRR